MVKLSLKFQFTKRLSNSMKVQKGHFKTKNITSGDNGLSQIQRIHICKMSQKILDKYKKAQQALHQECKTKKKDTLYVPGTFSTKAVSYVDFTNEPEDIAKVVSETFVYETKILFVQVY